MIDIYFDGFCDPNPNGIATFGFVVKKDGNILKQGTDVIGEGEGMTNNVAEYHALYKALQWLLPKKDVWQGEQISVYGDSQLVIKQVSGEWNIKEDKLKKYAVDITFLIDKFTGVTINIEHIKSENNKEADSLSRIAFRVAELKKGKTVNI